MPFSSNGTAALRLAAKAVDIQSLQVQVAPQPEPACPPGHAVVRVQAAGVNPSDAKAALGLMPQAVWPRTPGRDFAGTVVQGPAEWVGHEVWGSGGDVGITRDGSHGAYLVLPVAALNARPQAITLDEAAAVGVPFVTAWEGFRRSGMPQPGQSVAVMGANGKVGQAAVQLAAQAGAKVFAVQRGAAFAGFASAPVTVVDARQADVAALLREHTGGRGVDIVFNTVGSPYFEAANKAMAKGATQVFIATLDRGVPFDIFAFYRGMHTYVGIDTLALGVEASVQRLAAMAPGFEAGTLRPFAVQPDAVYPLAEAATAYRRVLSGDTARLVLRP